MLFDIGGVLTPDPYETILLHEEHGLGHDLNLTKEELSKKLSVVWEKYATTDNTSETEFWDEVNQTIGTKLREEDIVAVRRKVIIPNSETNTVFSFLTDKGIRLGIISNNTSFFYELQASMLPIKKYIDANLIFLSQEEHCRKSDGLFEVSLKKLEPSSTIVIDDRQGNVEYALKLGFGAERYSMESGSSLKELVKKLVEP